MAQMPAMLYKYFAAWVCQASAAELAPVLEVLAVRLASRATSAEIFARRAAMAARQEV